MVLTHTVHEDALTLANLLLAEWPAVRLRIRESGHPTCEGADDDADADDDKGDDVDTDKDDADDDDKGDDTADDDTDDDKPAKGTDWKKLARRHEREAKNARKREAELQAQLKARTDADLSEQEKAVKTARDEATAEVTTKYQAEQRTDRIENAVTKLSLRGFKAKADGKDITLKFADPDDAQLRLDRALRNGDVSHDDIYADGKVVTRALIDFLTDLLEEHPRLRAQDTNNGGGGRQVDMDGGKGKGGGKSIEDMTVEEHVKRMDTRR